ncbi:MAG TPA: acetyl-CoA C-acyltransferase [Candidatus Limnocylindrales bacterium]|jgi:acetyl-CoA C-acetyltransferase
MIQPSDGPNGRVFLVSAARTPIGKFGGGLASVPATELGGVAIRAAVERAGLPSRAVIDEVYMGQVLQAGAGQAPARQAALAAGLPAAVPATTINRVCGSGLKAIMLGAAAIRAGDADLVVAGGMESMNGAPFLLPKARFGYRLGDGALRDAAVLDGLWCAVEDCHMGTHAERVALSASVTRMDQDAFALESQRRAVAAQDAGRFAEELVPVMVRDERGRETVVSADESPRRDTTAEALGRLRPVFAQPQPDPRDPDLPAAGPGTVTAGNAPGITDGGAATVVASERVVEQYGLRPLARIVGYAQGEVEPRWLFLAPVAGVRNLTARTGLPIAAFDLVEINEAFAAQVLADGRELGLDWANVNVNGGAIALGHPIGASGARIVATLLYELRRRQGRYGLATLCLGGGGSVAMAFERV